MKSIILNSNKRICKIILWVIFIFTIFLSVNVSLGFFNICYLPINTTGECVIAHSLMSNSIFLPFLIIESILNILITIIYFIDGIKYNIKLNCILCSLNILFQPLLVMFIIIGVLR